MRSNKVSHLTQDAWISFAKDAVPGAPKALSCPSLDLI